MFVELDLPAEDPVDGGGVGQDEQMCIRDSVTGEASITAPGKVEVKAADGTTSVLEGKNILISTG